MFYLTPQERKFIVLVLVVFILGSLVQVLLGRALAPMHWAHAVRSFKININTARSDQLQMLPGIGVALSQRIVAYRKLHGFFKVLSDLQEVQGLSPKRFEHIKDLIEI